MATFAAVLEHQVVFRPLYIHKSEIYIKFCHNKYKKLS